MVPLYMLNEWLVLDGGLAVTRGFVDAAGSITIHAFGAYFGLGLAVALTSRRQRECRSPATRPPIVLDVGSMVLWLFWPSFCSAMVPPEQLAATAVNTILALCGATASTYVFSSVFGKGRVAIADMANAALAGGVAIGATCNLVAPRAAFADRVVRRRPLRVRLRRRSARLQAPLQDRRHLRRSQPARHAGAPGRAPAMLSCRRWRAARSCRASGDRRPVLARGPGGVRLARDGQPTGVDEDEEEFANAQETDVAMVG